MKINVFGRMIEVVKAGNNWVVFYLGNEGKKRPADDLAVPAELQEDELPGYLADLCHEWETGTNNRVEILQD